MGEKKTKPNKTEKDGREGNGQFAAGNNYGGSAPYSKQDREYKQLIDEVLQDTVTAERAARIFDVIANKAEGGHIEAAKFIFDRLLGKPITRIGAAEEDMPISLVVNVSPPNS